MVLQTGARPASVRNGTGGFERDPGERQPQIQPSDITARMTCERRNVQLWLNMNRFRQLPNAGRMGVVVLFQFLGITLESGKIVTGVAAQLRHLRSGRAGRVEWAICRNFAAR